MPDRVISVPQATQIATRIKNKFDNVNGRLDEQESATKSAVNSSTVLNNFWRDAEVGSAISGSASSNWQSATYPAKEGERYVVETVSYGTNVHCIVFLDADNVVVGRDAVASASVNTNVNQTVVAPAGTAKVIINKHSATTGDVGTVYAMAWSEGIEQNAVAISETQADVVKIDSFIKVSVDSSAVKNNFWRDAEVGSPITGSASNNWQCATFSVDENNWYFINTVVYGNKVHGIVFLDANNFVIGREVVGTGNTDTPILYEIKAPYSAVKMIVNKHSSTAGDVGTVKKTAWNNGISAVDPYNIVEGTKPTVIAYNKAQKCLNFAFITDLHINGYYGGEEATQTLDLFVKAVNEMFVDFSVFGGDLYSAYDLDYPSGIATADRSIEYLGKVNGLFLPVKGNHDSNAKFMALADASNLDWDNVTYYIYSNASHGYVAVTEETWDGKAPLHYGSFPDMTQAFSSSEYYTLMQSRLGESVTVDEDNPFSAWYYKDFDRYKIRVIVLDAFDAGDGETIGIHGSQLKWIAEHALDLSGKTDWQVIFFSHYYAESGTYATKFKEVTDAFISGGSVSGTLNGVSYSADYSSQGEGTIVALIHGHRHADRYTNDFGYNHIGVTRAFATSAELNTASAYAFDVFTIDRNEYKIYETRFGRGASRAYSYGSTVGLIQ